MTKHVQCPHCGQAYALTLEQVARLGGQSITCAQCNAEFAVSKDLGMTGGLATEPSAFQTRPVATAGAASGLMPGIAYANPAVAAALGATRFGYVPPRPPRRAPATRRPNAWAVASLVCGLLAILIPVVPGVLAVVFGLIALRRMRDEYDGAGLAMGGITVGVMGTLINGGVLLTYVLPTVKHHKETSHQSRCLDNLHKIAAAMRLYAGDHAGQFPDRLESILATKHLTADALICPATTDTISPGGTPQRQLTNLRRGKHVSYTYAGAGLTMQSPPECVLLYEELDRHNPGMYVVFTDGRVQFIGEIEATKATRRLRQGTNPPWTVADQ